MSRHDGCLLGRYPRIDSHGFGDAGYPIALDDDNNTVRVASGARSTAGRRARRVDDSVIIRRVLRFARSFEHQWSAEIFCGTTSYGMATVAIRRTGSESSRLARISPMPLGEHVVGVRRRILTLPLGQPLRWIHRGRRAVRRSCPTREERNAFDNEANSGLVRSNCGSRADWRRM